MSVRGVRWMAAVYFLLFAVAVTWPGMVPFNRIRPLVLGLPFSMVWVALWVTGGILVLWLVDRVERVERDEEDGHQEDGPTRGPPAGPIAGPGGGPSGGGSGAGESFGGGR